MAATSTRKQSLHEYAAFLMDQVDIVDLFEYLGLFNDGNLRVRGGKIIGRCIMPDHPNPDNPTAFCVDIDKKVYICRTKCRSGGNIITLLERLRGYSFKEAIQFLEDYLGIDSDAALRKAQRRAAQFKKRQEQPGNVRAPIELPEYRFIDAYPPAPKWVRDQMGEEVVDYFDLRYTTRGYYRYRILWPVHDHKGRLVGLSGRTVLPVTPARPKWLHTSTMKKSHLLFNLHRALEFIEQDNGTLYIVEGPKDVAALWSYGQPNVAALLGLSLSDEQVWLLSKYTRRVVLCLDNDDAAVRASVDIVKRLLRLKRIESVGVLPLPKGKDPYDIDEDTFHACKRQIVPGERFIEIL